MGFRYTEFLELRSMKAFLFQNVCYSYFEYQHETLIWLQTFKSLEELHPHN